MTDSNTNQNTRWNIYSHWFYPSKLNIPKLLRILKLIFSSFKKQLLLSSRDFVAPMSVTLLRSLLATIHTNCSYCAGYRIFPVKLMNFYNLWRVVHSFTVPAAISPSKDRVIRIVDNQRCLVWKPAPSSRLPCDSPLHTRNGWLVCWQQSNHGGRAPRAYHNKWFIHEHQKADTCADCYYT